MEKKKGKEGHSEDERDNDVVVDAEVGDVVADADRGFGER